MGLLIKVSYISQKSYNHTIVKRMSPPTSEKDDRDRVGRHDPLLVDNGEVLAYELQQTLPASLDANISRSALHSILPQ